MKVFVVLFNVALLATAAPQCQDIARNDRLDCDPDSPISEDVCHKRGCCWEPVLKPQSEGNPPLNVSFCFYGPNYVGYQVKSIQNYALKTVVTLNRKINSGFPKDSQIVILEITSLNDYSVR